MLSAIGAIEGLGQNLSVDDIPCLSMKSLALERALQIAGIGNILRHDYLGIRPDNMLNVIKHDLLPLKGALLAISRRLAD